MKQTQTQWVLQRLRLGPLTALEALDGCGCFRLAARIQDLRAAGHTIETHFRMMPSGKSIAVYQLLIQKELFHA
jgi:hypothetical protein